MTCCFFGHKDTPDHIQSALLELLTLLIKEQHANLFLVGCQGNFDHLVIRTLAELKRKYPNLQYYVVLQSFPTKSTPVFPIETLFPQGLETVPPKYAIDKRNRWMLMQSDAVICYLSRSFGGAAKYCTLAQKQQKQVFNLFPPQKVEKSR